MPDDDGADADADADTDIGDTPSNDIFDDDDSVDSSTVEDDMSPEDIDIRASIDPDADASDASDEGLGQHKDPDVGPNRIVLDGSEESGGLFDDLLAGEPIFKNKEILRLSYTPRELPYRTNQINRMATILVSTLCGETPLNILIYGKTGTGKTTNMRLVSQELEPTSQKYNVPCEVRYINCGMMNTRYCMLTQPTSKFIEKSVERIKAEQERLNEMRIRATEDPNALGETPYDSVAGIDERVAKLNNDADKVETVPITGWSTNRVYATSFGAIGYKGWVVVIMLDETNKLVEKSGDDMLYDPPRINSELDNSRISIMGILNDLKSTSSLDPRVKSSLDKKETIFPPYNANQLHNILQHRVNVAFKPDALINDVVSLCAAFAAQRHGDARHALDSLRMAGELAERGQADTVEEAYIRQTQNKAGLDRVVEIIHTLPTQSKIVFFVIILLEKNGIRNINTGEMFNIYKHLCEEIDADVLTQHRVTGLILELGMLGIVNAAVASKGRYGWTKEISLSIPINETEAILLTDSRLSNIESTQPFARVWFGNWD